MNYKDHALKILKENTMKITATRCVVLDILAKSRQSLNAYEISALAKKLKMKINTSTVYRILESFQKLNLVHFNKEQNGYLACQELNCHEKTHCHHQFVCKTCHKVEEIHLDDIDFIKSIRTKNPKFQIQNHYFEFFGQCASCI